MADETPIENVNHKEANSSVALDMIKEGAPTAPPELTPAPDANAPVPPQTITLTPPEGAPPVTPVAPVVPAVSPSSPIPAELMAKAPVTPVTPAAPDANEITLDEMNAIKVEELPEPLRVNFSKIRDKLNGTTKDMATIKAERDALQARIDNGSVDDPESIKNLRKMYDDSLDTIGKMNLNADPRFVAKYEAQKAPLLESIKSAVASYDIEKLDAKALVARASQLDPRSRMSYLQSQIPEEIQSAALGVLLPMFSQIDVVENARTYELEQHKDISSAYSEQQTAASNAALTALRETTKTEAVKTVAGEDILLQRVEGNDAWNTTVDALNDKINLVFAVDDPAVHAKALVESQLAPVYKAMFFKAEQARAAMEKTLVDRNIALPNLSSAPAPTTPTTPQAPASQMTAEAAAGAVTAGLVNAGHLK